MPLILIMINDAAKIRYIGVVNHDSRVVREALEGAAGGSAAILSSGEMWMRSRFLFAGQKTRQKPID
eukprot:192657-Rhodomonas_salina.2